jgi:CRISPR-associated protein Cas5t
MTDALCLLVEVPVCAFRPYASREYQDTYPVPTPASVYGMLLSLLGVPRADKARHRGAGMALAVEAVPEQSKVFRKLRRGGDLENTRPDYQDVLTDLRLWVWVRRDQDAGDPCLADRLRTSLADRCATVTREGGVSLGESSYLVNAVTAKQPPHKLVFVVPDTKGFYSLPVWVDHVEAANTKLHRFRVEDEATNVRDTLPNAWFPIPTATS